MEDRLNKKKEKAGYVSMRVGGLYDSRVGSSLDGKSDESDTALMTRLNAGYLFPLDGPMGFRVDYSGYADAHRDFDQYNIMDHTLAIEPQYSRGSFVYGLPLSMGLMVEDNEMDSMRQSVAPMITWMMPGAPHALAAYGSFTRIDDRDKAVLDEDGRSLGMGIAYVRIFGGSTRFRVSVDYMNTNYDARVIDYGSGGKSDANRDDDILSAGMDIQYMINSWVGLFSSFTVIRSDSNVDSYDYSRNLVEAGLVFRY